MGADIGTEDKNVVVISEDMTKWSENVILAYNNPKVHYIMLVDEIITIQDMDEDEI